MENIVTPLPRRTLEALRWAAEGKTNWEIGSIMGISMHGASQLLMRACTKLGAVNRTHAVVCALRQGLIQ